MVKNIKIAVLSLVACLAFAWVGGIVWDRMTSPIYVVATPAAAETPVAAVAVPEISAKQASEKAFALELLVKMEEGLQEGIAESAPGVLGSGFSLSAATRAKMLASIEASIAAVSPEDRVVWESENLTFAQVQRAWELGVQIGNAATKAVYEDLEREITAYVVSEKLLAASK